METSSDDLFLWVVIHQKSYTFYVYVWGECTSLCSAPRLLFYSLHRLDRTRLPFVFKQSLQLGDPGHMTLASWSSHFTSAKVKCLFDIWSRSDFVFLSLTPLHVRGTSLVLLCLTRVHRVLLVPVVSTTLLSVHRKAIQGHFRGHFTALFCCCWEVFFFQHLLICFVCTVAFLCSWMSSYLYKLNVLF